MKILYLHQYFNTPKQAGSTRSYEMAKRLVQMGHEVTIITSIRNASHSKGWKEENIDGIRVLSYPVTYENKMNFFQRIVAFLRFSYYATIKSMQLEANVVFATSTPLTIGVPGYLASRRIKCPLVFEVRDLWPEVPIAIGAIKNPILIKFAQHFEKFIYRKSTRIVALSPDMAKGIAQTGYPNNKIATIPNAADLDVFDIPKIRDIEILRDHGIPGGKIILYPGTLGYINGISYLVNVAEEMLKIDPKILFVVIGDGAERSKIEALAHKLGVFKKNFFILEPMPKTQIAKAFSESTMIVSTIIDIPTLEKNSANKFFDAMAAGKPIAINYGGWQKELIEEKEIGLALNKNPKESARQIFEFINNPYIVKKTGSNSKKLAKERFSRDILAKNLELILKEAINNFQ